MVLWHLRDRRIAGREDHEYLAEGLVRNAGAAVVAGYGDAEQPASLRDAAIRCRLPAEVYEDAILAECNLNKAPTTSSYG